MKTKSQKLIIILGNLTAFGPFITDFYLPCLPELVTYFSATPAMIQTSLTTGMWGLAAGQIILGPVCDKFGRKYPLLICLGLFILATVGCMLSTSVGMFVACRLLQGLTGAGGLVISKAIVTDIYTAAELTRNFAILAAVQGAAPIVAPIIGALAFSLSSWQGSFALLGLWGIFLFVICHKLPETLPATGRLELPIWRIFQGYIPVLTNGKYLKMNLLQSFSSGALLSYIAASPFIFQEYFSLSPTEYGFCFAINSLGLVAGSTLVMKMKRLANALFFSVAGLVCTGVLAAAAICFGLHFLLFEAAIIGMLFSVGMITPLAFTLSLVSMQTNRGAASALLGAFPFMLGGIVAPLTGLGNIVHSMSLLIVICAAIAFAMWIFSAGSLHDAQKDN